MESRNQQEAHHSPPPWRPKAPAVIQQHARVPQPLLLLRRRLRLRPAPLDDGGGPDEGELRQRRVSSMFSGGTPRRMRPSPRCTRINAFRSGPGPCRCRRAGATCPTTRPLARTSSRRPAARGVGILHRSSGSPPEVVSVEPHNVATPWSRREAEPHVVEVQHRLLHHPLPVVGHQFVKCPSQLQVASSVVGHLRHDDALHRRERRWPAFAASRQ